MKSLVVPIFFMVLVAVATIGAIVLRGDISGGPGTLYLDRSLSWLLSVFAAIAAVSFFLGTSITRRRILHSMKRREIRGLSGQRRASDAISKRREIVDYVFGDASDAFFANRSETRHFMSRDIQRVMPTDRIKHVAALMNEKEVERVYVVDEAFHLMGVISKDDLHQRAGTTAADIMTTEPVQVAPEDSLQTTAGLMLSNDISCLPVCMEGLLVGQINTMDIIVTMECAFDVLQGLAAELREDESLLRVS